jgi:hypothetical protein
LVVLRVRGDLADPQVPCLLGSVHVMYETRSSVGSQEQIGGTELGRGNQQTYTSNGPARLHAFLGDVRVGELCIVWVHRIFGCPEG